MQYTELQVTTNFSFLRGASHPEELVEYAADIGYTTISITDRNTLAGIVRAHATAKLKEIRLIVGCRLDLLDGPSLLAYPTDLAAYSRLSRLLTTGNMRAEKGKCFLYKKDVFDNKAGFKFIMIAPEALDVRFDIDPVFRLALKEYHEAFGNHLYLSASRLYTGNDSKRLFRLTQLSQEFDTPLIATNDVHYHTHQRRELQDVVTCIREKCTIDEAGYRLYQNAERYLKPADEMLRLFRQYPDAIHRTQELADACRFSLAELKYEYPDEVTNGRSAQREVTRLAWEGAKKHFGEHIPEKIRQTILYELKFLKEVGYAKYFLTVYDAVRFANEQGILCQGRGSAANSTVCFCLGITSVNPAKFELLFERFISSARNEPPDIDVDFEHERREEVIQYIYNKYGRDRAAIVATVTTQHQKGAIRDVGRVMGLSVDTVNKLSGSIWEFTNEWFEGKRLSDQGLSPEDPLLKKVLQLTEQFMGFPRQLGQHTGGFVISQGKLHDLVPLFPARMENRVNLEWNKDDIDVLKFMKIDILALGMLTCIRKAFDLAKSYYGLDLTLANVPGDDPAVYDMVSAADTIGVFQIESRAQQSMLPRLRPRNFYDLVIEVAIVRPGPIQGDMVHPYLRRRNGLEPVEYPSKELEDILGKTLGVPLFQEQAMKIAIVAAGFTPSEADDLRRSMATFKLKGLVSHFEQKMITGMMKNGYTEEYARRVFKQLEGFGSYGFPESHAASFAQLVYISSWIKCYYPEVFVTAILNSMPMGFYQPAQLVIDAKEHGVVFRPIDINHSRWDHTLEEKEGKYYTVRLGFRQIKGMKQEEGELIDKARSTPYTSIHSLRDAGIPEATLEKLADGDAFNSIGLDRRQAMWEVSALKDRPTGLFTGQPSESVHEPAPELPLMTTSEHVVQDYSATALSLKAHPVSFLREKLAMLHIKSIKELDQVPDGAPVKVTGLVLSRQRPGTAGGVCFITIEDETGNCNLIVFQNLFDAFRKEILQSKLLMVEGKLQREGAVVHIIVRKCHNLNTLLRTLTPDTQEHASALTVARDDEQTAPYVTVNKRTQVRETPREDLFPGARNFR